jgi:hypothetical protein
MIDLDKMLSDVDEARSEKGDKRRKRKEAQAELGPGYEGYSEEALDRELEKKKSKARYEALRALGNGK